MDTGSATATAPASLRYLVTNMLEVVEASAHKVLELVLPFLSKDDSSSGVIADIVLVTPEKLREMVLRALLGSSEVLRQSFPPRQCPSAAALEEAADTKSALAIACAEAATGGIGSASDDGSDGGASFQLAEQWVSEDIGK